MSLLALLDRRRKEMPAGEAIRIGPPLRAFTYSTWWDASAKLASRLPAGGKGFLALRLGSDADLPFALLAAWMRGLAVLPLPAFASAGETRRLYAECGEPVAEWNGLPEPGEPVADFHAGSLALLLPTSGTSAAPKVFAFRHEELLAGGRIGLPQLKAPRNVLNLRPAHTSGGTNTIWPAMFAGTTLSFAEPPYHLPRQDALGEALRCLQPSLVVASPAYLRALCEDSSPRRLAPGITPLYYGGLRLRAIDHERLHAMGFEPTMRYGMTECAHVLSAVDSREEGEAGFVGAPVPGLEVKVDAGKLCFSSPAFASTQLVAGEAKACLAEGFYRSDDRGEVGESGIVLRGREYSQIVVAGFRFSPAEIEQCLMESGELLDCLVLPLADPLWSQRAAAVVVPKSEGNGLEARLREHCRSRLSPHKIPSRFVAVAAIPATAGGKRDSRAAAALFGANYWESHFALWKRLRGRWRGCAKLRLLAEENARCMSGNAGDLREREIALRGPFGKHSLYQAVWGWNALAFQHYRHQGSFAEARRCLGEGLRLAARLEPGRYGSAARAVEAVWLVILLNYLRLDLREGKQEQGARKITELRKLLAGGSWNAGEFGDPAAQLLGGGELRFGGDPQIADFLAAKLDAEETRRDQFLNSKSLPS